MFTGIIEEIGTVTSMVRGRHSAVLTVRAKKVLEGTKIGDSIAVNGICLTVTALSADGFSADIMHETLNRSSLTYLKNGSRVNLERAMQANGRFGGHIVAGHADGTGTIIDLRQGSGHSTVCCRKRLRYDRRYQFDSSGYIFRRVFGFRYSAYGSSNNFKREDGRRYR